jgi:5-methylcytosine-specific restriction endonuclease McrA
MTSEEVRAKWRAKAARQYAAKAPAIRDAQNQRGLPCRKCRTMRAVDARLREKTAAEGGPLCRDCRRSERDQLLAMEAKLRAARIASLPAPTTTRRRGSGRGGTGNARYRKNRILVLSASDICGICKHPGAATVDHIIPKKHWGGAPEDFDDLPNLQPAHGSLGAMGIVNRCTVCGRLCNQSKGSRRS